LHNALANASLHYLFCYKSKFQLLVFIIVCCNLYMESSNFPKLTIKLLMILDLLIVKWNPNLCRLSNKVRFVMWCFQAFQWGALNRFWITFNFGFYNSIRALCNSPIFYKFQMFYNFDHDLWGLRLSWTFKSPLSSFGFLCVLIMICEV